MLTLFVILAFIFIVLIACVPTEKNSKDVTTNSYEESFFVPDFGSLYSTIDPHFPFH